MKLKLDDKGNVVVQDGKPVYVGDDGKDVAYDAPAMHSKIIDLGKESKTHREAKEAAEIKLKAFEGITDPEAAKKALETVANIDAKKLVDAGQVETIKAEAVKAYEAKIVALNTNHANEVKKVKDDFDGLTGKYNGEKIAGAFSGSKFVGEKLAIPADLVQARFGSAFKVEDGKIIGYDAAGNKLFSRSKPGDPADFDEAIELLVEAYPNKEHILKGTGHTGGGGKGGSPGRGDPALKGKGDMGGGKADRLAAINARFGKALAQ